MKRQRPSLLLRFCIQLLVNPSGAGLLHEAGEGCLVDVVGAGPTKLGRMLDIGIVRLGLRVIGPLVASVLIEPRDLLAPPLFPPVALVSTLLRDDVLLLGYNTMIHETMCFLSYSIVLDVTAYSGFLRRLDQIQVIIWLPHVVVHMGAIGFLGESEFFWATILGWLGCVTAHTFIDTGFSDFGLFHLLRGT